MMPSNKSVSDAPIFQFTNCRILRSHQLQREDLWVREGKILNPEKLFFDEKGSADIQLDCKDSIIAPGFIDVQINGGFGVDFSLAVDDVQSGISLVSQKILSHGVTSFCPTLVTSPPSVYHKVLPQISVRNGGPHGAGILGAHLEGPFISKEKKGAHPEHYLSTFESGAFQDLLATYRHLDCVRIVTLAPEMKRSSEVIQELTRRGICVSLGHSVANLSQAEEAVRHGATFITHLFNAMLPFHHRDPGIVGLLTSDQIPARRRVFYGMISDGIHTNPAALRIAHRAHPKGLVLVTDAIAGMGLAPGRHTLGQQVIEVDGLNTYIAGTKTLSGSVATMDSCVRHFLEATGNRSDVRGFQSCSSATPAFLMEETPQGTFQDELEWCILQLETGLLRLNPTPKQAEETQHILKVLRSRKAAFVKKRQVMNRVFGDYRLKMAEEQKRTEKAAMKPGKAQIQQGNVQASGSVVYRKRSGQTSESTTNWFTPSDNSFRFSFALPEMDPQATNGTMEEAQGVGGSEQRPSELEDLSGVLNFSTPGQQPKFAFNFVIPDKDGPLMPSVVTGQRAESIAENVTSDGLSSAELMTHSTLLEANMPEVVGCVGGGLGREALILETPKPEIAAEDEVKTEKTAAAGAPKKKKKKKSSNSKKEMGEAEVSKKVKVGARRCEDTDLSLQDKTTQQSDKQLWREVEWCVEQLELGLKTHKSTPKQAEEALHAIKTLRSDKAVLAKKRQVMRAMFGDYRKKMEEERQKQLKLMQAAAKSAQVMEVRENARRKSSQVFRKCSEVSRKSPSSAGSPSHLSSHPESPQASGTNSFVFPTSQEEFRFNFF